MEQNRVGRNAVSLVGEIFLTGASQYMAGNVASGIVHSLLAMGASALLIGSGAVPVIGALAVLAVKLNSYSSATTGRNLWDLGTEAAQREQERLAADVARAEASGGQSGGLQIILAWDDRNDLDLHVVCPNGEEIAYNNKRAGGGELDVAAADMDAPVENIRFEAPAPGRYQIFVVLYSARAVSQSPFRVTIRRQGQQDQVIPGIARQQGERQLVQTIELSD